MSSRLLLDVADLGGGTVTEVIRISRSMIALIGIVTGRAVWEVLRYVRSRSRRPVKRSQPA